MHVDPTGHSLIAIFAFLAFTTIVGAVIADVNAYNEGKQGGEIIKDVILGAAIGLAVGGAIVALSAVIFGAIGGTSATVFGGVLAKQA